MDIEILAQKLVAFKHCKTSAGDTQLAKEIAQIATLGTTTTVTTDDGLEVLIPPNAEVNE